ncbi:hypothetical protein G6F57_021654 [Rhizopus arrhizus]|nr:hypothetical protein G6F57_021654 [Rhizopus arrhizus]
MSDAALRERVQSALAFEPGIEDLHIGVAVEDGVVTLTGHVAPYAQKLAAEEAVQRATRGRPDSEAGIEHHCMGCDDS